VSQDLGGPKTEAMLDTRKTGNHKTRRNIGKT